MNTVVLASGGIDSTLVAKLYQDEGATVWPLFVNYRQLAADREWAACKAALSGVGTQTPVRMDLSGFGSVISSGLTDPQWNINKDAFLPGRNLLLLVAGAGYAYSKSAGLVAIGLLSERQSLFPDQSQEFIRAAESAISSALGIALTVEAPLAEHSKSDVMALAAKLGLPETYSCHAGTAEPCGDCIACQEIKRAKGG